MKTYDIACQVRRHLKVFDIDMYMAQKVQAYYRKNGRKVSITRITDTKHALHFVDFLSLMEECFYK
jgi:N-acetylmuramoyl-L-alanine amidase